jgi:transglutaminase-like putative cysteine protease
MNIHQRIDMSRLGRRVWWVMLAGCAARFAAERSVEQAVSGFLFWAIVFTVCWMLRTGIHRSADAPARAKHVGNGIAVAGMLLFLLRLSSDGILPALLAFLFAIQAAVFVVAEKRLHVWLILSAAFAGLLFAAAESRSPLFLLCAAWFTFAALGLLALDYRGERECMTTLKPLDKPNAASGGLVYGTAALLLAIPFYLFVPKPDGLSMGSMQAKTAFDYGEQPEKYPISRDGESRSPEPAASAGNASNGEPSSNTSQSEQGQYADSFSIAEMDRQSGGANVIVLYVKSSQSVYLRGRLYDRFERDRWLRDVHESQRRSLRRGFYEHGDAGVGSTIVKQSIEVATDMADNALVHVPGLRQLRFPAASVRSFDDGVFEAPRPLRRDTVYSVESHIDFDTGRYVVAEKAGGDPERYLHIPDTISDRLRELARRVTAAAHDPQSKALALEEHLRTQYSYSYETVAQQGYTPLDWFLFEGKRGHCEYFASALAMMLRTVGVEARVATGFSLGERNPVTGYYEVRALDGHAWVEARIPGKGWLMMEPTPFYPLPTPRTQEQVAEQMDRYLDRLAETSKLLDPESVKTTAIVAARETWRQARLALKQITDLPQRFGWYLPALMIAAILLAILAYLAVLLTADALGNRQVRQTLKRAESGDVNAATLLLADALHGAAEPRGFGRKPGWTFREYVRHLAVTDHAVPRAFAELFDVTRYGQSADASDRDALTGIDEIIENALRSERWPRFTRAVRSVIPAQAGIHLFRSPDGSPPARG